MGDDKVITPREEKSWNVSPFGDKPKRLLVAKREELARIVPFNLLGMIPVQRRVIASLQDPMLNVLVDTDTSK